MPTKLETCKAHEISSCPWCALDEADRELEQQRQRTEAAWKFAEGMGLKGGLTISRTTSNHGPDNIRITLRDEASGCDFATAEVALADFAQAVTGLGCVPCDLWLRALENIGKRREVKRELLPALERLYGDDDKERAREAIKPYEVDGWRGHADDLLNGHRRQKDGRYAVTFIRFVDADEAADG